MITLAQNDTLYVSDSQTIHLRFDSELLYVNLGDNILVARIADNSKADKTAIENIEGV